MTTLALIAAAIFCTGAVVALVLRWLLPELFRIVHPFWRRK